MFGDGKDTVRQPAGHIIVVGPEGPPVSYDTLQCVHCQAHWIIQPGSGRKRGWCLKCMGPLCGKADCMARCVPFEAKVHGEQPW